MLDAKWQKRQIPPFRTGAPTGQADRLLLLERCTRPFGPGGDLHAFARFTEEEMADQVQRGLRPPHNTIQKLFLGSWTTRRGLALAASGHNMELP